MPITPRLFQKLHETLGEEAAELVNWIHRVDARFTDAATRGDLAELREATRGDIAELREATRGDIAELRQEMRIGFAELRQEMQVGFAELRQEMARLEARFERRFSDLIKWSFVFWVGAVAAIAMLAKVLP